MIDVAEVTGTEAFREILAPYSNFLEEISSLHYVDLTPKCGHDKSLK